MSQQIFYYFLGNEKYPEFYNLHFTSGPSRLSSAVNNNVSEGAGIETGTI